MKTDKPKTTKKKNSDESKMIMKPWDLIQSKYKFNIYQKRMELYIVNEAQSAIQGERHIAGRKIPSNGLHPIVEIPLSLILQDEDESNYSIVKKSAKAMTGKVIEYTDADGTWTVISPIISVKIPRYSPTMYVEVHREMWNAILDYRQGWRKFDINTALSLKSVYSIKLYEFISLHTDTKYFSVDDLKDFFGVKEKYKQTNDFIRFVLEPVKKELDESSPWSFDYTINRAGESDRSKITGFAIKPYSNGARAIESERTELTKQIHLSAFVPDHQVRKYLLDSIGFTKAELCGQKNKRLLAVACKVIPDMIDVLTQLRAKSREKNDPKGWIIGALQGKVDDYFKSIKKSNPLKVKPESGLNQTRQTLPLDLDDIASGFISTHKI